MTHSTVGPYSPAVRAGDLLFISGQIGMDGADLAEGFEAQARSALRNLEAVLIANGASLSDVVKTTVYLTDMSLYSNMNDIYAECFANIKPARAAIGVRDLPRQALIEIEACAYMARA